MTLTLVQRIKALRPTLTDEDFFKNVRVESSTANDTQTLVEWNHPSLSRPTDSELGAVTQSDYDKISHRDNITDMCLMSMCQYQIMANSTYSWWGAWLSNSKDVIAPKLWFGPDGQDPRDVYVDRWEYLDVK